MTILCWPLCADHCLNNFSLLNFKFWTMSKQILTCQPSFEPTEEQDIRVQIWTCKIMEFYPTVAGNIKSKWEECGVLKQIFIASCTFPHCQKNLYVFILFPILKSLLNFRWICKKKHCMFPEHWNRQKILSDIRQCFSCLLDEGITKNEKEKISGWLFFLIHFIRFEMHMDRPDKSENVFGIWY